MTRNPAGSQPPRPLRFLAACLLAWNVATCAAAIELDFLRSGDPDLTPPAPVLRLTSRPLPLWIAALSAPEADLRREAAETIIIARRQQMPDLQTAEPALRQALGDAQQPPAVVAAVARALIALECREAAPALAQRAESGSLELALIIEPALARWDYEPLRRRWLDRVADRQARRALRILAIESLATVGERAATPQLQATAVDPHTEPTIRLSAAQALGKLQTEGLEETARRLMGTEQAGAKAGSGPRPEVSTAHAAGPNSQPPALLVNRLVAAWLLRQHGSETAQQLLGKLAVDPEPAVAAVALERLVEQDFRRVLPLTDQLTASGDANVRLWAAKALVAERTPAAVSQLEQLLDDPHPAVRGYVRESLLAMTGEVPLREAVWAAAQRTLAGQQWRGLEQAVLITVALERQEVAERLVELLDFARPEVYVAAAWALRRLAVPATRPALLQKAERLHSLQAAGQSDRELNQQFCHLAEAFRQLQAVEAIPLLNKYISKNRIFQVGVRGTAIWTLGHLFAGQPDDQLARALADRINDTGHMDSEDDEVRAMAAVTLGRMGAASELPTLRKHAPALAQPTNSPAAFACGWAIHKLTGEPLPVFRQLPFDRHDWFLEPAE